MPGTRPDQNTYLVVALLVNAQLAIKFGVIQFLEICRGI